MNQDPPALKDRMSRLRVAPLWPLMMVVGVAVLLFAAAALRSISAEDLAAVAEGLLGRSPRPHELFRLAGYAEAIRNLPIVLLAVLIASACGVALKLYAPSAMRALIANRRVMMVTLGAAAVIFLRQVDPLQWYLTAAAIALVASLVIGYLVADGMMTGLRRLGLMDAYPTRVELAVAGSAILFLLCAVWVSAGGGISALPYVLGVLVLVSLVPKFGSSRRRPLSAADLRELPWILLPVVINLAWALALFGFELAPPDADITSQAQIAAWLKAGDGLREVVPYSDQTWLVIKYPPAFATAAAASSIIFNADLNFTLLWLWVQGLVLLSLSAYALTKFVFGSSYVAAAGTLAFMGPEILRLVGWGQAQELLALSAVVLLLRILLAEDRSYGWAVVAGLLVSAAFLLQPQVVLPFLVYLVLWTVLQGARLITRPRTNTGRDAAFHVVVGGLAAVLVLPWLVAIAGTNPGAALGDRYHWVYSLTSSAFWGTKGTFYAVVVTIGAIVFLVMGRRSMRVGLLLASAVLLSQYHWLMDLFDAPGYSRQTAGWRTGHGITTIYSDPWLPFLSQQGVIILGFGAIFGLIAAYAIYGLDRFLHDRGIGSQRAVAVVVSFSLLLTISYRAEIRPAASLLNAFDLQALRWIRQNTSHDHTFVLNPPGDIPGTNARLAAWWVGAVSERKTAFSRIRVHEVSVSGGELLPTAPGLKTAKAAAAKTVSRPCITHVFVPARRVAAEYDAWVDREFPRRSVIKEFPGGAMVLRLPSAADCGAEPDLNNGGSTGD